MSEGEFGGSEEITFTYVVVRVGNKRRVMLPAHHALRRKTLLEQDLHLPDLMGTVFLSVDHRTSVGVVREKLHRIGEASEYWDGDACALHVTNATERCVERRAIASTKNAPELWKLRCEIREKLIAYL